MPSPRLRYRRRASIFVAATTTSTTAVNTAPTPLMSCARRMVARRRWSAVFASSRTPVHDHVPLWLSVNDVNTPMM